MCSIVRVEFVRQLTRKNLGSIFKVSCGSHDLHVSDEGAPDVADARVLDVRYEGPNSIRGVIFALLGAIGDNNSEEGQGSSRALKGC